MSNLNEKPGTDTPESNYLHSAVKQVPNKNLNNPRCLTKTRSAAHSPLLISHNVKQSDFQTFPSSIRRNKT